jgi:hypothetical protein
MGYTWEVVVHDLDRTKITTDRVYETDKKAWQAVSRQLRKLDKVDQSAHGYVVTLDSVSHVTQSHNMI